jgi:dGTP triphosphohydrolase
MTDMALRFDTLKVVERLERGGFTHDQAKTCTEVLAAVVNTDVLDAATKADVQEIKAEIRDVRTELATIAQGLRTEFTNGEHGLNTKIQTVEHSLRTEIQTVETNLRSEIKTVEAGLRTEIKTVEAGLRTEINAVEHRLEKFQADTEGSFKLLRWMMGFMLAMMSGILYKLIIVN